MLELPIIAIALPFIAGLAVICIPKRLRPAHEILSIVTSCAVLVLTWLCFTRAPFHWVYRGSPVLRIDHLSGFVSLFIAFFSVLITIYSAGFMKGKERLNEYYAYILWTLGGAIGAAFSNNLILLLIFWGFLGATLYILISLGGPDSAYAAKKTFIIIGGSDAAMLLGIAIIWYMTGSFTMDAIHLPVNAGLLAPVAFLCLAIGAFAKAGAMPFHTWIPDSSEAAPLPVMAYLPASLDKLLGIYLLARLTLEMFVITQNSLMSTVLLAVGSVTIIAAVMMALVQHNFKRLLAYHAVSQVGYMVLGLGTANPIGIAGGLFHMVNHAIYKACLFLSSGSVEHRTHTAELDELGGLARLMPLTFVACLIASLSISGVPPFNGFFSKWMVYQAVVELGRSGSKAWVLWLVVAMFGSALTLASFMKVIYSAFLSPRTTNDPATNRGAGERRTTIKEVSPLMWLPQLVLASLCLAFGIFAWQIPLKWFVVPSMNNTAAVSTIGIWDAPLAAALMIVGLGLGLAIFLGTRSRATQRRSEIFIGGGTLDDCSGVKGASFYNTVKDVPMLGALYKLAEKKVFDIYEDGNRAVSICTKFLQWLHNGILSTYMVWSIIGMAAMFIILFFK